MENQHEQQIGVLDSGLGGLTVVRELKCLLPDESIVYIGDNANCPYGNRSREEILNLAQAMLAFLEKKNIKIAAIACNTISILAQELRQRYKFPIVSIIEEACKFVAGQNFSQVGVFATEFTIKAGLYTTLIKRRSPKTNVYGVSSRTLAALVEEDRYNENAARAEVSSMTELLLKAHPDIKHAVLGCTHYPHVQYLFEEAAPDISFINPAAHQAEAIKALLSERGLLSEKTLPRLDIYTSGGKLQYEEAVKKMNIRRPHTISIIECPPV